jgi:NADP-dependent 3-hydroxy acid dehydrogenase YdfG
MSGERKLAVITSASRGIGAVLVKAYRDRNYRVVATARSIGEVDDDEVLVVPSDNTDRKTTEHAIQQGVSQFKRIDALVNNAGIFIAKPFTRRPLPKFES